jgi:hypothetical protein
MHIDKMSLPFSRLVAANAHATDPLTEGPCRGIEVTVSGDLTCRFVGDDADVTIPVTAGATKPWQLSHVRASSTAEVFVGY